MTYINFSQEKQKNAVIEALAKKGSALCDLLEREASQEEKESKSSEDTKPITLAEVDEIFAEIQKWVDSYDVKALQFTEKHAKAHHQYGRALKAISKQIEEKASIELDKSSIEVSFLLFLLSWIKLKSKLISTIFFFPAVREIRMEA